MIHFRAAEFRCSCQRPDCEAPIGPHQALGDMLDIARQIFGRPIVITSGNRCSFQNASVNGEDPSEHVWPGGCLGADLRCSRSRDRSELVGALSAAGISRIGVYPRHVHAGVGNLVEPSLYAESVLWIGKVSA